jgi:hypothetical protein
MIHEDDYPKPWPVWQKILFRFFFIYLLLHVFSWNFFEGIPLLGLIGQGQQYVISLGVTAFNDYIVHFQDELVPLNGSGDTSFGWVQVQFYLFLAALGTVVWSIIDRKRESYYRADYYMKTCIRYFIATISFVYGSIKIVALQMPFPSLSDMATPLGDFLPMRFSWHFVGYSPLYQVFSGMAEVIVGLLLLYRRTVTLGLVIGLGVYMNVMMINLAYDVPVKIFSTHMVIMCLYLLMTDIGRLANFFIFNRPAVHNMQYHFVPSKKSRKIFRYVVKGVFLAHALFMFISVYGYSQEDKADIEKEIKPIPYGMYEVNTFVKNGDTLPVLANDSLVWKDFIFEHYHWGSYYATVNSRDTIFRRDYGRGSFNYSFDSVKNNIVCYKFNKGDSIYIFTLNYRLRDKDNVELWTNIKSDSLYLKLTRSKKQFKMAERQFHWLSESNR